MTAAGCRPTGSVAEGTIDDLPEKSLAASPQVPATPTPNLTGTMAAFRPDGSLGSGQAAARLDRRLRALDPGIR